MVHVGKCYKVLIDLGAVISPIRYCTYQTIDRSLKMPTQATMTTLNTADGPPVTALGMMAPQLRIVDFKFTHNFIICNRLPDTEMIFCIGIQTRFSLSYAWDKEKHCFIQKDGRFLIYTRTCEQKATIGIVRVTLKIHPDTMASFQSRSKDTQLKDIHHTLSVIKIQQRGKIPT